ncbi:hypothetical protein [Dechloromonas denitrificans]|uniref:hypothetical protein n=1 Tax=Dechloromonas denitrificans TaxID=281362 RepID=UPI001CF811B5|nr:hypothetical protein [Dechloromonas denitrificans]UCV03309.1 hypothetical protein KI611_19940 [Dechloromonas denitrificans]
MEYLPPVWHGYADAKPSESIQKDDLPGLAVAVIFPWKRGSPMLDLPIKQYKDYQSNLKGTRARQLADWLAKQKNRGLVLSGFFLADTQLNAANMGLSFLEELPNTHVQSHYGTWRLHFGDQHIDLAQAVALEYYFLAINFGLLRAGYCLEPEHRRLFVAMDRFPGKSPDCAVPGKPLPASQGSKFLEFVRYRSAIGIHIEKENTSIGLKTKLGALDWWKARTNREWRKGKTHPHFTLPDWLAAAALAEVYPEEFAASSSFKREQDGIDAVDGLTQLYKAFKLYDLWSAGDVVRYLRPSEHLWTLPEEARAFILERAER